MAQHDGRDVRCSFFQKRRVIGADRKLETRRLPAASQHAVRWRAVGINVTQMPFPAGRGLDSDETPPICEEEERRASETASGRHFNLPLQLIQDIPQLPLHHSSSSQPERKHTDPVVGAPAGLRGRSPVSLQPNPIRDELQTKQRRHTPPAVVQGPRAAFETTNTHTDGRNPTLGTHPRSGSRAMARGWSSSCQNRTFLRDPSSSATSIRLVSESVQ